MPGDTRVIYDAETFQARACEEAYALGKSDNPLAASDLATTALYRTLDAYVEAASAFRTDRQSANIAALFRSRSAISDAVHALKMACLDDVQRMHGAEALTP
jgi:hypothetical protein